MPSDDYNHASGYAVGFLLVDIQANIYAGRGYEDGVARLSRLLAALLVCRVRAARIGDGLCPPLAPGDRSLLPARGTSIPNARD